MLTEADLVALWTTLRLATIATLILLAIGTPLAWWLATDRGLALRALALDEVYWLLKVNLATYGCPIDVKCGRFTLNSLNSVI